MARIFKRGKTWAYRVSYIDKDGKRQQPSKSGFRTRSLAKQAALELESNLSLATDPSSISISLLDYYDRWLAIYKTGKHSRITESRYATIRKVLLAYFGTNTELTSITRSAWQSFINDYAAGDGKPRARETVSKLNGYIRSMCADAIADGIIKINFASKIQNPGYKSSDKDLKFLEADDFISLKEYATENASLSKIYNYVILAAIMTGARASEIIALQWTDIDWESKAISISKSWDYVYTKDFKPTKTTSSVREIAVPDELLSALSKLKREQSSYRMRTGYRDSKNLVFRNARQQVPSDYALNKDLKRVLKEIKASKTITFHGLRHTHVSYLLSKGVDIAYLSHRLGHSDIAITMRVYSHLLAEHEKSQGEMTQKILSEM